jgi:heterodisulfide reductase subunit A2
MSQKTKTEGSKVGVYICHCGGNISDVIDVKRVAEVIGGMPGVALSTDYIFMCSDPGQQKIKEAIQEGKINRVVVAACSPRLHEQTFRRALVSAGLNQYLLEQVNIREQASWVHKKDHEGATEKAIRLIRGAVEKVKITKPLDMIEITSLPSAVVVGAGLAGLRAASDLAQRGSTVYLIEKTPFTGGNTAKMDKLFPTEEDAREIVSKLNAEIEANQNVTLLTSAEVIDADGGIGNFKLKIKQVSRGVRRMPTETEYRAAVDACPVEVTDDFNYGISKRKAIYMPYKTAYPAVPAIDWAHCSKCGSCGVVLKDNVELESKEEILEINAGIIIAATGYVHYEPQVGEYGFGAKNVITLPQLIRMMDRDGPTGGAIEISEKKLKNIGFIHCVGSRQTEGINKPGPDGKVNAHCSRVCCTATLQAAIELKERYKDVNIIDLYQDIRTYGRDQELKYYDAASKNGVLFIRYSPNALPEVATGDGKIHVKVKDLLTAGEEVAVELDLLVLSTGMMPETPGAVQDRFKMPKSADRFLQEVHPKLRPVETAIGGIFLAGTAQAPFDTTETTAAAGAAAVKAASILEGGSVHLEPYVAKVDTSKCKGHGECVKVCPAKGAIFVREADSKADVNTMLCISCGNCVAVCPEKAVDVQGYEIAMFEKIVDEIVKG